MLSLRNTSSKGPLYFAVAVTNQEADALVWELEAKVACLLRYPDAGWVGRTAGEPDASAAVGDEEQCVVAAQEHALDGKKSQATMLPACACSSSEAGSCQRSTTDDIRVTPLRVFS